MIVWWCNGYSAGLFRYFAFRWFWCQHSQIRRLSANRVNNMSLRRSRTTTSSAVRRTHTSSSSSTSNLQQLLQQSRLAAPNLDIRVRLVSQWDSVVRIYRVCGIHMVHDTISFLLIKMDIFCKVVLWWSKMFLSNAYRKMYSWGCNNNIYQVRSNMAAGSTHYVWYDVVWYLF